MIKIAKMNPNVNDIVWKNGDADFDIFAHIEADYLSISPGETKVVPTGLRFIIPVGYNLKFEERSGLASKGISIRGGVIDESYRGECKICVHNSSDKAFVIATPEYLDKMLISDNDIHYYYSSANALCQVNVRKTIEMPIVYITEDELENDVTDRGSNGFGSSDLHK